MRNLIKLIENQIKVEKQDLETLKKAFMTLSDWIQGDAMTYPYNEDGEKFSIKPYYNAMNYISKRVEPNRLNSLNGTIYRGVMLNGKPTPIHAGLIKTSIKQYQPWTPSYKVAETFALEYSGNYGVIFHANVAENKNKLLLSIIDAVNLYNK